jgi:dTDP-6-deoxy-L-talose 4-dehydrogenase (NAD+)
MDISDTILQKSVGLKDRQSVLVTGATGFIGSYVIAELLKSGCEIIATSSNEATAKEKSWFSKVKYIVFDLKEFDNTVNYQNYFNNPTAVIHLAWEGLPNYKAAFHTEENLPRHFAFIKNLITQGQKNITITGTCFEYGMQQGCLTETMETKPENAYAIAKDSLRRQLQQLEQQNNFLLKWARLFYMYGTGQNPNSLLSQLDRALENGDAVFNMSGGEQVRDYLPVEKVAEYIVKIALQQNVTGIINCCSGAGITVKDFVRNYLKEKNKTINLNLGHYPYADYEPMSFWGDDSKLKSIINKL